MSQYQIDRRKMLCMLGGIMLAPHIAAAAPAYTSRGAGITLLGTAGGPPPHMGRSQPATLVRLADRNYLIDAGENVAQQLMRAGVPSPRVAMTLLTHLHWDHTLGLDYLMASGWMMGRSKPMPILGPPGTRDFASRVIKSVELGEDIFRVQSPDRPKLASLYPARDVRLSGPAEIHRDGEVRISAIPNTHFTHLHGKPHSYGADVGYSYRFDAPEGSVVLTGDTGPSETLAAFAKAADVMVAEIVDLPSMRAALQMSGTSGTELDTLMEHMEFQHLVPTELGKIAQAAGVKRLVLSHFVIGRDFNPDDFVPHVAKTYGGEIIVGKDLMQIKLGG